MASSTKIAGGFTAHALYSEEKFKTLFHDTVEVKEGVESYNFGISLEGKEEDSDDAARYTYLFSLEIALKQLSMTEDELDALFVTVKDALATFIDSQASSFFFADDEEDAYEPY